MSTPVQRWRIVYGRGPEASGLSQRDELAAWEAAVAGAGLPLVATGGERPRPRIAASVPLPIGMVAEAELIEIQLSARKSRAEVRTALEAVMPPDHRLVDVHDVWLGAPSLPASVVAAVYGVVVTADDDRPGRLLDDLLPAVERLTAAERLPRERSKVDRTVSYDLRPFLLELVAEGEASDTPGRAVLRMRLRVDPQLGTGRPDEVVAALGETAGRRLVIVEGRRTGLELA
jgi:radical SAM-linked protein